MNIVQQIYNAPVAQEKYNIDDGYICVVIEWNNEQYSGSAFLHKDDKDFYSQKVGRNIALSRARLTALKDIHYKMKKKAMEDWIHYCRVSNFSALDNKPLYRKALNSMQKAEEIKSAIDDEKQALRDYIDGQEKVITIVKRLRANPNKDNIN